jgi:hypothetical protein
MVTSASRSRSRAKTGSNPRSPRSVLRWLVDSPHSVQAEDVQRVVDLAQCRVYLRERDQREGAVSGGVVRDQLRQGLVAGPGEAGRRTPSAKVAPGKVIDTIAAQML